MQCRALMVQGTASSAGKSVLVTALCRIFRRDGFKVAPFKSQNMSLNSFVTPEGGEIGRAQAVQAEAAGIAPSVYMNPVLLKPEAEACSQVIVLGKVAEKLTAAQYYDYAPRLLKVIQESLEYLQSRYDIIVIEGAGSPAEINLKARDIVNMRIARLARAPVLLIGDIDRGGVFASLVGTLQLLTRAERKRVAGLVINKFRGDITLLQPGLDMLEQKTGKPVLGVVPYLRNLRLAQEDSVYLEERKICPDTQGPEVAIIHLPHISNFDDFDPLSEAGCNVRFVSEQGELGDPDLIILPGTKSTVSDLIYLRQQGLEEAIIRKSRNGTPVIGICGGYQMLGKTIRDPGSVESGERAVRGLGLLDIETLFGELKTTTQVKARVIADKGLLAGMSDIEVSGYEIHMGQTAGLTRSPVFQVVQTPQGGPGYLDGTIAENGLIFGTYLHGLFHSPAFTAALLDRLRKQRRIPPRPPGFQTENDPYDELARVVRENLDIPAVYRILKG